MLVKQKVKIAKRPYEHSAGDLFRLGVINLNKPSGPRCRNVVQKVKAILEVSHAGHAGTLDPKVTGVLTIGLEKATKILGVLSKADKTYVGKMRFHGDVTRARVQKAFREFTGRIKQLPPRLSAVKRTERTREIYSFKLLDLDGRTAEYRVHCEAGTYIRKLCHDVGDYMGVGAHMTELRRVQSGAFKIESSVTLPELSRAYRKFLEMENEKYIRAVILPVEAAVQNMPKVWIDNDVLEPLSHGSPIYAPGIIKLTSDIRESDNVAVFDQQNRLVSIGIAKMNASEMRKAEKGTALRTDIVLIQ